MSENVGVPMKPVMKTLEFLVDPSKPESMHFKTPLNMDKVTAVIVRPASLYGLIDILEMGLADDLSGVEWRVTEPIHEEVVVHVSGFVPGEMADL